MREQAPPPRPAHRTWFLSNVMLALALATSLAWYMFWVVMASIELDIKHIVNWYFFARFNLTTVPHTYEGLERVGYWMPLFVFFIFLCSCIVCPCRTHMGKVPPVIYTAVVLHNLLMFVYMAIAGGKIVSFFNVILPVQFVLQLHNVWWLVLLAPTLLVLLRYVVASASLRPSHNRTSMVVGGSNEQSSPATATLSSSSSSSSQLCCCISIKPVVVGFVFVVALHLIIPGVVQWAEHVGCAPCQGRLPKKPGLIAHRGCGFVYPENTILSFVRSSQIPGMIGLETDVQVSYDGVPFLLHDPHTIRTTDVLRKCPDVDPLGNATWLNFTSGSCPLEKLNVGKWFTEEQTEGDTNLPPEFSEELMPTLLQFLRVAKERGMTVIFDLREPNTAHPFHGNYINASLKVVQVSGIDHSKVWWLTPERRDWVVERHPHLVQTTKTEDTPFKQFHREKIRVVNDDWGTPLEKIRQYQAANLSVNLFFVDSQFAFSYAWCVGANSVTTNNCKELASLSENKFYQVCYGLRQAVETQLWPLTITFLLCSISCMTCFECMQRVKRKKHASFT